MALNTKTSEQKSSKLAFSQTSGPVNVMTLNGTWDLYTNTTGAIGKIPDQSMNIMIFDGNKLVVQGITMGDTYWIG